MRPVWLLTSSIVVSLLAACGESDDGALDGDNTAYTSDPNKTVVVGSAGATAAQASGACVTLPSGECVEAKQCGSDERRDVVVDSGGKVIAVVCYPADSAPPTVESDGDVTLGKTDNNGVVAIDGAADGVDIAGDVGAPGNNVVVYGEGPGLSVIGGSVDATGNNFSLRGVTVKKNVRVQGNNATLVLCVIEGDVLLEGNNNVIADCSIGGKLEIRGSNNTIIANEIAGGLELGDDKNTVCDGNVQWTDANANMLVDPGETGAALRCGK